MAADTIEAIYVPEMQRNKVDVYIHGDTPLLCHDMALKTQMELLSPSGRKTAADKASTSKHNPLEEYRLSIRRMPNDNDETLIGIPTPAFKGAMCTAALHIPKVKKTDFARLLWITGFTAPVWGIPQLRMDPVRMADQKRTPDIRTRACIFPWCSKLEIMFMDRLLTPEAILRLLSAAGMICGVGDFRQEKGKGTFGQFSVSQEKDERIAAIMRVGGRAAQLEAMENPDFHDDNARALFEHWQVDIKRTGKSSRKFVVPSALTDRVAAPAVPDDAPVQDLEQGMAKRSIERAKRKASREAASNGSAQ